MNSAQSAEETVRALDDEERRAALQRDVAALGRLWSEQFTVNAPNNTVVVGRDANLDAFVRSGIIDFARFDRSIEFLQVDGPFAAIMGLESVVPNVDAPTVGLVAGQLVRRRFTNIWRNENGTWRLYWRHANIIPTR
ncbi:MAG TPA: nuclear transport factor 2 family protein [Vicinamibacterales bacterium]